ncbi:hypothetical protein LEADMMO150B3_15070 [Leclercia adecarboxylata]|jgi:hypothetical protein
MSRDAPRDFAFSLLQMFDVGHELAYKEYRFENQHTQSHSLIT